MATWVDIMDGMATAIWQHAHVQHFGPRATMHAVPDAAIQAAEDLERLYCKMNCVETLQELMTRGVDIIRTTERETRAAMNRDFGYRLGRSALGLPIHGHLPTALTPAFHIKYDGNELVWDGQIDLGIDGRATAKANPGWKPVPPEGWTPAPPWTPGPLEDPHIESPFHPQNKDRLAWQEKVRESGEKFRAEMEERRRRRRRNPSHHWPASQVQSILFAKGSYTEHQAKAWAKEHGYHYGNVDGHGSYWRLRQLAPTGGPCRTIEFGDGIKAVVCSGGRGRPPGVPNPSELEDDLEHWDE